MQVFLGSSLASTIHHASTFCLIPLVQLVVALPSASTPISSQLRLVPWHPPLVVPLLVTAFGVVCNSPLHCIAFLLFGGCHISQGISLSPCPPLVWLAVVYPSTSASPSHHLSPFPLLSRSTYVASVGTPLLLPSLHASVVSTGSPPPLPLPHAPVARMWPQGGSECKWMMFVFWEHRWSWAKKPAVLASCDKINAKLT